MNRSLQAALFSTAFAGLVAGVTACGGETPAPAKPAAPPVAPPPSHGMVPPPPPSAAAPNPAGAQTTGVAPVPAEGGQPAAAAKHSCKGVNECKGQGGCHVDG